MGFDLPFGSQIRWITHIDATAREQLAHVARMGWQQFSPRMPAEGLSGRPVGTGDFGSAYLTHVFGRTMSNPSLRLGLVEEHSSDDEVDTQKDEHASEQPADQKSNAPTGSVEEHLELDPSQPGDPLQNKAGTVDERPERDQVGPPPAPHAAMTINAPRNG